MKRSKHFFKLEFGVALPELMVSSAVLTVVAAVVLVGSITLQKSFRASQHYARSQASQLRLLDYVALDLRRALTVNIPQRGRIDLTIPNYYEIVNAKPKPRNPLIVRGPSGRSSIQYGAAPIPVSYYIERSADGVTGTFVREENGVKSVLAREVREFLPDFERSTDVSDKSEQVFKVSVTFAPKFHSGGDTAGSRQGTKIASRILLRNKRTR